MSTRPAVWLLLVALALAATVAAVLLLEAGVLAGGAAVPPAASAPGAATVGLAPAEGLDGDRAATPSAQRTAPDQAEVAARRFVVVDHATRRPLDQVVVRLVPDGTVVGRTGPDGATATPDHDLSRLAFQRDGYLLGWLDAGQRQYQGMLAAAADRGHVVVSLWRDDFTVPLALRFVTVEGEPAPSVRFTLRSLETPPPSADTVPGGGIIAPELRQVWHRHVLVARMRGFADLPLHFGLQSAARAFVTDGATVDLRLLARGRHALAATSAAGVAELELQVLGSAVPRDVVLRPGQVLGGSVHGADGAPVTGAEVRVQETGDTVRSGADGGFRLGPLAAVAVHLEVRHAAYETRVLGPVAVRDPVRVALVARPRQAVRGVVRSRPRLTPVAGAVVRLLHLGEVEAEARSGPDGAFELWSARPQVELRVAAARHLVYAELLAPAEAPATYDLLPATVDARVVVGLTARIHGEVVGPAGEPRPQAMVRLVLESGGDDVGFAGLAGRRVLEGGYLMLPQTARADAEGRFELECAVAGDARLLAVGGAVGGEDGVAIRITPGRVLGPYRVLARP